MTETIERPRQTVHDGYFTAPLAETDPEMARAIADEHGRQRTGIELIASENIVSRAVLEAQGSLLTNKTVEGYPGRRYHGGASEVDGVERLAIERACGLFGCAHANVQPHSGSQANHAVYRALLEPGDRVLAMSLDAGGHLSHGSPVNLTASVYDFRHYGVRVEDGRLDYEEAAALAEAHRPRLLVAGGSAYPRVIDFERLRAIADSVGALLMVDMAHFAGLVAGLAHPSPVPLADVVTTTTYKSLRGARGGLILCNDEGIAKRIDAAVFPGVQGSPQLHGVAAKAVSLAEAADPAFRRYAAQVVSNARTLAATLAARGLDLVTGGTDTALMLLDLRRQGLTGRAASSALERAGITCNKNAVPGDPEKPMVTSGVRLGVAAVTTRGFAQPEMETVGGWIADVLEARGEDGDLERSVRADAEALTARFPIY